jgi:hypothetical protein
LTIILDDRGGEIMPGSPYIETPEGLLTWPKLLRLVIPTFSVIFAVALWKNLVVEFVVISIIIAFIIAYIRK